MNDRALDAIIAGRVMGLTVVHLEQDGEWVEGDGYYAAAPDLAEEIRQAGANGYYEDQLLPYYSTDIVAAWTLIEHHPHYVYLVRSSTVDAFGFHPMTWRCRFYAPQTFEVEADTAPLAICRAALKVSEEPTP